MSLFSVCIKIEFSFFTHVNFKFIIFRSNYLLGYRKYLEFLHLHWFNTVKLYSICSSTSWKHLKSEKCYNLKLTTWLYTKTLDIGTWPKFLPFMVEQLQFKYFHLGWHTAGYVGKNPLWLKFGASRGYHGQMDGDWGAINRICKDLSQSLNLVLCLSSTFVCGTYCLRQTNSVTSFKTLNKNWHSLQCM